MACCRVKDLSEMRALANRKPVGSLPVVRKRGRQGHQQLVNSCIEYLRVHGVECAEFKQGKVLFEGRWIQFGKAPGWPDIIAVKPPAGRFYGIECKVGRDFQKPEQVEAQKRIEAAGGLYVLARSVDDLASALGVSLGPAHGGAGLFNGK